MTPTNPTIEDFPSNEANCGTCTRKGGACPRSEKKHPNGYVISDVTKTASGIIYKCPNYTGPYEAKSIHVLMGEFDEWVAGKRKKPKTMRAVVYDQFGSLSWAVSGTRREVLEQYKFYKECHPDRILGLVSEECYRHTRKTTK